MTYMLGADTLLLMRDLDGDDTSGEAGVARNSSRFLLRGTSDDVEGVGNVGGGDGEGAGDG